jgi:uncharacterized membrane protein YciS (DUF1049 family)
VFNWTTIAVFLVGTIIGAIVKSVFEMSLRSWLERRAKRARKQKRKLKKAKKQLAIRARQAVEIPPVSSSVQDNHV